ncbi:MAG TPA: TonB-dependent receptor [Candidatus Limnocylindrales bacterium]|nr:TonB-dependent receptor [Candidatus Limnocylindrales bacterium]
MLALPLALGSTWAPRGAWAEETEVEIPTVVIEDERLPEPALTERSFDTTEDVTGFGETIMTEPSWQSFESTAELLGQSVGAQIRRQGGRDDYSTLSIRGAPAAQVRVLLDGVSLGRADDSVVNLADIPVEAIERIEVHRGSAPAGVTAASAASVVNIITKQPRGATAGAAAGLGSFDSGKIVGFGSGALASGTASALATVRTTKGDFEFVDDRGTRRGPNSRADDRIRERENNESDSVATLLRYRRPLSEAARVLLREHFFYKNEGVPGLEPFPTPQANLETTRNIAALALEASDSSWALETNVLSQREKLTGTRVVEGEASVDNVADSVASTTQGRFTRTLADTHRVGGSAEVVYETFDMAMTEDTGAVADADRWSLSMAASDEWTLARWRLTLIAELRHQQLWSDHSIAASENDHSTDPRGGLRWQPLPSLAIKANVGTYFRAPSFNETFGTDGFSVGNPLLQPESGINRDVGFEWSARVPWVSRLDIGYAYFHNDVDDLIVVVPDLNRRAKSQNVGDAHVTGHEVRIEAQVPWGFALSANYTYQDADNRTPRLGLQGKQIPGLPPHEAYGRLSWTLPWTSERAVVSYDIEIDGEHFIDSSNDQLPIPTRVVHGLALVLMLTGGFRLSLEAENLGNSLVPDEIGSPLPSRAFYATLSWSGQHGDDDAI